MARINHVNRVKSRRDADNGIPTSFFFLFLFLFLENNTPAFAQAAWEARGRQKPLREYYLSFRPHSISKIDNDVLIRSNAASLCVKLP